MNKRGFTFVELLVVVVLGAVVLTAAVQLLITNQRIYTANAATIQNQQTTRMGVDLLFNELREVSARGGDIIDMRDDELEVRMMRKFSIVCALDLVSNPMSLTVLTDLPLPGTLRTNLTMQAGSNTFAVADEVFVFADNDPDVDDDDVWIQATIRDVSTTAVTDPDACPTPNDPATPVAGLRIRFTGGDQSKFAESEAEYYLGNGDYVQVGAAVRSYETYTFGITTLSGDSYIGRQIGTGAWVPLVGPIDAGDGLEFVYRDQVGAETGDRDAVRLIEVTLRTTSGARTSTGALVADSVTALIYTRN